MFKYAKSINAMWFIRFLNRKMPIIKVECEVCGEPIFKRDFNQIVRFHKECRKHRHNRRNADNVRAD